MAIWCAGPPVEFGSFLTIICILQISAFHYVRNSNIKVQLEIPQTAPDAMRFIVFCWINENKILAPQQSHEQFSQLLSLLNRPPSQRTLKLLKSFIGQSLFYRTLTSVRLLSPFTIGIFRTNVGTTRHLII